MKSQLIKKLLRRSGYATLALVGLLALFILEENVRGRIMLARYKAELRAKGEKLTVEELNLPKPSSDTSNAAALLEVADRLAGFTETNHSQQTYFYLPLMRFIAPGRALVVQRQEQPSYPGSPITWEALQSETLAVSNELNDARIAVQQQIVPIELDYSSKDLYRQWVPLFKTYYLRRWLVAAALDALHRKDLDSVLEDLVTIAEVRPVLKNVHVVGVQGANLHTAAYELRLTWQALQADGWTDLQLSKLQECWQGDECLSDLVRSLEIGRAMALQRDFRDTFRNSLDNMNFNALQHGWEYRKDVLLLSVNWLLWRASWFEQDQCWTLRRWEDNLDDARAVACEKSWTARSVKRRPGWTFHDRWRYLAYGSYSGDYEAGRAVKYETLREMTMAAIALRRYRLRFGSLPASLSALVPEFLPKLPHDWMDGKPLRYRLNADGTFTLYSVGENAVDDGGDPETTPVSWYLDIWGAGDEVWPAAATQEEVEAWETRRMRRSEEVQGRGRGRWVTEPKSR